MVKELEKIVPRPPKPPLRFSNDEKAVMPPGFKAPLEIKTTRQLISERLTKVLAEK